MSKEVEPTPAARSKAVKIEPTSTWQAWANFVLIPLIVALGVYLFVRTRNNSADAAKQGEQTELTLARLKLSEFNATDLTRLPVGVSQLAVYRDGMASQVRLQIDNLLTNAKDPGIRAESLILQGDLNWALANFPALPGAATQPSLAGVLTPAQLLTAAKAAYHDVVANYPDRTEAAISARLGLAAVAENEHSWDEANQQYQAVIDAPTAPASFVAVARQRLAVVKSIREPLYLAVATQPAEADASMLTTAPSTQPTMTPSTMPSTTSTR